MNARAKLAPEPRHTHTRTTQHTSHNTCSYTRTSVSLLLNTRSRQGTYKSLHHNRLPLGALPTADREQGDVVLRSARPLHLFTTPTPHTNHKRQVRINALQAMDSQRFAHSERKENVRLKRWHSSHTHSPTALPRRKQTLCGELRSSVVVNETKQHTSPTSAFLLFCSFRPSMLESSI